MDPWHRIIARRPFEPRTQPLCEQGPFGYYCNANKSFSAIGVDDALCQHGSADGDDDDDDDDDVDDVVDDDDDDGVDDVLDGICFLPPNKIAV